MATKQLDTIFTEKQYISSHWWIWPINMLVVGLAWWGLIQQIILGIPFGTNPGPDLLLWIVWGIAGVALPLLLFTCHMVTEVKDGVLRVRYFPIYSFTLSLMDIESAEAITYKPIWEYGGWGLRYRPGHGWAYNVYGNRGVRLKMHNGKTILIGSQRPDELQEALSLD